MVRAKDCSGLSHMKKKQQLSNTLGQTWKWLLFQNHLWLHSCFLLVMLVRAAVLHANLICSVSLLKVSYCAYDVFLLFLFKPLIKPIIVNLLWVFVIAFHLQSVSSIVRHLEYNIQYIQLRLTVMNVMETLTFPFLFYSNNNSYFTNNLVILMVPSQAKWAGYPKGKKYIFIS